VGGGRVLISRPQPIGKTLAGGQTASNLNEERGGAKRVVRLSEGRGELIGEVPYSRKREWLEDVAKCPQ